MQKWQEIFRLIRSKDIAAMYTEQYQHGRLKRLIILLEN